MTRAEAGARCDPAASQSARVIDLHAWFGADMRRGSPSEAVRFCALRARLRVAGGYILWRNATREDSCSFQVCQFNIVRKVMHNLDAVEAFVVKVEAARALKARRRDGRMRSSSCGV